MSFLYPSVCREGDWEHVRHGAVCGGSEGQTVASGVLLPVCRSYRVGSVLFDFQASLQPVQPKIQNQSVTALHLSFHGYREVSVGFHGYREEKGSKAFHPDDIIDSNTNFQIQSTGRVHYYRDLLVRLKCHMDLRVRIQSMSRGVSRGVSRGASRGASRGVSRGASCGVSRGVSRGVLIFQSENIHVQECFHNTKVKNV